MAALKDRCLETRAGLLDTSDFSEIVLPPSLLSKGQDIAILADDDPFVDIKLSVQQEN